MDMLGKRRRSFYW